MADIRAKLLKVFDIEKDYTAVLISGSGTAALEMGVSSCISDKGRMLVIENGVYGERISKIADVYNIPKQAIHYQWGEYSKLEDVESALKEHADIEVVAMVHHETTTGLLNPIQQVGELANRYGKKFLVDCISSQAGETIDFEKMHIDYSIGTANKCIQGFPGVAFVLARKTEMERIRDFPQRSLYFHMAGHFTAQEKGDTLFTPAIQSHYALDEALDELLEETVTGRIARYSKASKFLREGFTKLGLNFLIPPEQHSNTLTALKLPNGITYPWLHDRLKEKEFVIYAGQGAFNQSIFRIANMGEITMEEYQSLLTALEEIVNGS